MGIYFYFKVFICFSQIIRLHPISRCNAPAPILLRRIGPMRNVNLDFKNYVNTVLVSLWQKKSVKKCLVYAQNRLIFSDIELEKLDFRPDTIPDT
jgi:hypothetical protein